MKTLRRLILLNAALLFLVGLTFLFSPSFAAPEGRLYQQLATLRFLATGMAQLAFVLMVASASPLGDWRKVALWLSAADVLIGLVAFYLLMVIWGRPVGWFLVLLLVPFGLAAILARAGLRPLKPAEIAAEITGLQIPGVMREALLRQIGEAAAQEERNRLARDLHDSIKQQLFSINVGAATAQERWDRDPEGALTALTDIRRSAREAMVEMQALLHQLRPRALGSTSGLVEALREQCEALGYRSGAQVTVELGPEIPDERMPPGAQEALFRIAQEALANVARHARARHVHLWLGREEDSALLRVEDDGQGFDLKAASSGMGLRNIRERLQSLGGMTKIATRPGAGVTIAAQIPLLGISKRQESRIIETATNQERSQWLVWLFILYSFVNSVGENPIPRLASFDRIYPPLLLAMAAWSWWRERSAVKIAPGADPVAVLQLRYLANRSRIFLILLAGWWALWFWGLTPVGWTGARIAWGAMAVFCLSLAVIELVLFHRHTQFRRSLPRVVWKLPPWSAKTTFVILFVCLTGGLAIGKPLPLSKLALPQLLGLYAGGVTLAYIFSRHPRIKGASQ